MTEEEKVQMVQLLISDVTVTAEMIQTYLALAANRILNRVWPFGGAPTEWPTQYDLVQVQLTVRMVARRGGEGETAHSENGISRTYGSVDDEDILQQLVPYVGVV
jgi:hypothetical protein